MTKYRSAQGKMVDMTALAAKNEKVRAVGNMKVNARGDVIDSTGKIIKPVTEKVNSSYSKTVGNKSANAVKNKQPVVQQQPIKPVIKEELTDLEKELDNNLDDDLEVEKIRANELGKK